MEEKKQAGKIKQKQGDSKQGESEKEEGKGDTQRKKYQKPPPTCACGADRGECKKEHEHHIGNDLADWEANEGRRKAMPAEEGD